MGSIAHVGTVDLRDFTNGEPATQDRFVAEFGRSLVETGFVKVSGHGVPTALLDDAYRTAEDVFALADEAKDRYVRPELGGARGLIPFGREQAKDASIVDLKEFWHIGPEDGREPANVWPDEVPEFQRVMGELVVRMDADAQTLLEALAVYLGLASRHLADLVVGGDPLLRVLHYPPLARQTIPGAVRASAHEDINFITLLPAATDAGLELKDRDGTWLAVDGLHGELVVDSGDMLSRYLNGRVPATTHRVVNPEDTSVSRYSMPFFCQPRHDVLLVPPPELRRPDEVIDDPITAGEFHAQRMEEIRGRRPR